MELPISTLLKLPPEEIIKFYEQKGYKFSWKWQDVWKESHFKAFTVAKAIRLDILQDFHSALIDSYKKGYTSKQFRDKLEPILMAKGWYGKVKAKDVPGYKPTPGIDPNDIVQLGSPWRLNNIFRTNMSAGYSSNRYKRMIANAANRPYWLYVATLDNKTRPKHRKLHGEVFRYDDPIWEKIFPPNDWGCRCGVIPLSEDDLKRRGLKVSKGSAYINKLDFISEEWSYNPAKGMWDTEGGKPEMKSFFSRLPVIKPFDGQKTYKDFKLPDLKKYTAKDYSEAPKILSAGKSKDDAVRKIQAALELSEKQHTRFVSTPVEKVMLHKDYLTKIAQKRSDKRERYANYILPTLENPQEVYVTKYSDGHFRRKYVKLFTDKGKTMLAVVRINRDGSLFWNVLPAEDKTADKFRTGQLIFTTGKK